ncbi:MAG TPA: dienelactone hydrolase family protein [Kofleriaceae bacterium]|jgi:dienelactone hydrolase|nr:dienelactone hydrolase family protein [Kofleriaceae bacterium]
MITRDIAYECDGTSLTGYLADGAGGRRAPGILVCHQGMGLGDHARERARMLAELGYVAFALDMYGQVATSREQVMALIGELVGDPPRLRRRAAAGLDVLKAQTSVDPARLAAIGYCFGGGVVLEMARCHPELACVVSFHPGLTHQPEHDDRKIRPRVMVCAGVGDPLIPPAARERLIALMTEAEADWQLLTYGNAGHAFTDRTVDALGLAGFAYHAPTDRRSWAAMRDLFDETLAG